jgi:tetratricopeptide (TPR) repeat protein
MKKTIYIIVLLFSIKSISQSEFHLGFEAGFREGYCYGKPACVATVPIPIPSVVGFTYKDGYNNGFQMGLDKQRGVEQNTTKGYVGTPATFIDNAMFKLPYELMMQIIDKKDKDFEEEYGSLEKRTQIFRDLLKKAEAAFNKKEYYSAINFCNQAEKTFLTNPMIDMILGGSYYSNGDYDNALRHLKIAKSNGYYQAEDYIVLIKKKEKEMSYERPIKFGAKLGLNSNSFKSSPLLGLFFQGRTGKWGIKNFSILTELQFYKSQYNQEVPSYYSSGGKTVYVNKDNILQINLLFKRSLNKNVAIIYGTGLSSGLESASSMIDLNAGLQYHISQYVFTEFRYNRNLTRSYFQGDGELVYKPNNIQISLGYKF